MMNQWTLLIPELIVAAASFVFLYLSSYKKNPKRDFGLAMAFSLLAILFTAMTLGSTGELFSGTYKIDLFSQLFKLILLVSLLFLVWLSRHLSDLDERSGSEYFYFLFSALLGFLLLPSAVEFITLFVALELASIALYILIPLRKGDGADAEAGIKYFLMSAAASAVFLYGASLLFGFVKTTDLRQAASLLSQTQFSPFVSVGLLLISVAFFFKLAVVPFHFWAPDVYQSANNQITALIATASKVVAVAILLRFLSLADGGAKVGWLVAGLSVASMTLGNLAAIWQKDIKRLLAYSTIAQAGYILIGFLALNQGGTRAVFYYAATYLFANLAAFHVVIKLSQKGKNLHIADFIGLSHRSPLLALTLLLSFLSLAGIPPLVGFAAKWFVFTAAVEQGYVLLVLFAFIMSVVSLYYYLLVIKSAYLDTHTEPIAALTLSWDERAVSIALIAFLTLFGLFPGWLLRLGEKITHLL